MLFLCCYVSAAQTTTLSGKISYINGNAFNGTLQISIGKATVLNTCASPVQVVPNVQVTIPVTNGAVISAAQFLPTYCLYPSVPYYVQVFDSKNVNVTNASWYIEPEETTGTMNVGDLVLSNFGGPIVVSVPMPIVSNPSGSQTITQPPGTYFSVNNLVITGTLGYSGGIISASISGNAGTATALQNNPTTCPTGNFATGIYASGNAICSNAFPVNSVYNTLTVLGGTVSYSSAGAYINYNVSGTNGEQDFLDNPGANPGGWCWSLTAAPTTCVVSYDALGNITADSFIGPLTGNSSTATALSTTGSNGTYWGVAGGVQQWLTPPSPASAARKNCLSVACAGGSTYSAGTTYTNSSTTTVSEEVTMGYPGSGAVGCDYLLSTTVGGAIGPYASITNDQWGYQSVTFTVPVGVTFSAAITQPHSGCGTIPTITSWSEVTLP